MYSAKTVLHKGLECIELSCDSYTAIVAHTLGGNVLRLRQTEKNVEVFRFNADKPIDEIADSIEIWGLPTMYFPNRLDNGVLKASDYTYHLPVNEKAPFNNTLHGFLHRRPYKIESLENETCAKCTISYLYDENDEYFQFLPIKFKATLEFTLDDSGLLHKFTLENLSERKMPISVATHTKFVNGAHYGAYAPLGYIKDPEQKGHLLPDTEYKWIVEKMFELAAHGNGGAKIRGILEDEKVPIPAWINFQRYGTFGHIFKDQPESKRYQWTTAQVKKILSDEVYIGHSIHNRQTHISFKNKKKIRKPKEEWFRVENTHEPIISKELWDQAQAHINSRKRPQKNGETQIFAGLLKCADCGWGLRYLRTKPADCRNERRIFTCTTYSEYGKEHCTIHYIKYDTLYAGVLKRLQYWIEQAQMDEEKLLDRLLKSGDRQRQAEITRAKKDLAKAEKRLSELDNLFAKLYEDRAKNAVSERNYAMLSGRYQDEQIQLEADVKKLKETLNQTVASKDNAERWISIIRKYTNLTELTAPLLNELIDKIVVHEATKDENGKRVQVIDIYYRFVGMID